MSDKSVPTSKVTKTKRQSAVAVSVASSSSRGSGNLTTTTKDKNATTSRSKTKKPTPISEGVTKQEGSIPEFDAVYRQIAYGKFLRAMLEDCMVDEKIEREETLMDIQMAQLQDRMLKTMDQLDKTNRRLKDISFVVEQKRLLDMKNQDCTRFYEMTDESKAQERLRDLTVTGQACLDQLETKNIDYGYNKETGHKQLLDTVTEALDGLEQIKKHCNLDNRKFEEYQKSQASIEDLQKSKLHLENLRLDFEAKFPKFSEKLLKEASEKIAKFIENDDE